ncbi:MAG TPA: hypothetical protein VLL54_00425 [Pyrinomonadaceae bacterium]|nr:hypothetical protein [Pyrinomonadaceae bacterium]
MKKFSHFALLLGLLLLPFTSARAQDFPWDDFERRTLKDLVKLNVQEDSADLMKQADQAQFVFRGKILPSVVRVAYTGKSKPLSDDRKKFIELWAETYSQDATFAKLFALEYLFKEGADEYWLPVEQQVAQHFAEELTPGGAVDLYLLRTGGLKKKDKNEVEWMFLVEEFLKPKDKEWVTQSP